MRDWQAACAELWGADWIAPLSEVLRINRRTVERWRSGATAIPEDLADQLWELGRGDEYRRAYGIILRRIAKGEAPETIRRLAQITTQMTHLYELRLELDGEIEKRVAGVDGAT
jgi:hypothetical protein